MPTQETGMAHVPLLLVDGELRLEAAASDVLNEVIGPAFIATLTRTLGVTRFDATRTGERFLNLVYDSLGQAGYLVRDVGLPS